MNRLLAVVALMTCLAAFADIEYNDPVVLSGDWMLNPNEHVYVRGNISGTGDIRYTAADGGLGLLVYGANTAIGNIYVNNGNLYLFNSQASGTGAIYVTAEEPSGESKSVQVNCAAELSNVFYLGSEAATGYRPRLVTEPGVGMSRRGRSSC